MQRTRIRTLLMHVFHFAVSFLCVQGVQDTQCGFKLFTRKAAKVTFTRLHIKRWAFDVEVLFIAQVSILLFTVTFYANLAHSLTRSP